MKLLFKNVIIMTTVLLLVLSNATQAQFFSQSAQKLLPEDEAFQAIASIEGDTLNINWVIADGYYMYRDNFSVETNNQDIKIGEFNFPKGEIENDPEFGEVEVYFYNANLTAPISGKAGSVDLVIKGQGCNKPVGVCYPPLKYNVTVEYINDNASVTEQTSLSNVQSPLERPTTADTSSNSETQDIKPFWTYVFTALVAGWLLSFTPCVLPMIPILAGIIAGQKNPSRAQSGWLAICYVLGTIFTYAIAGWVAGASGTQLQAYFQNPWVIGSICAILIALAFSLFGAFKIQLPSSIQTKLNGTQVNNRSASVSSFILGLISALVVGACVSPILIITLGAAINQGDPVLGAAIMSAMALGMGTLLILFGFGAGWLLPKTGAWMLHVQVIFGFMVLGVAIYLSSSLALLPTLLLWAALLIWTGLYLFKMSSETKSDLISSGIKTLSIVAIIWGVLALVGGVSTNNDNILKPLNGFKLSGASVSTNQSLTKLTFNKVTTLADAQSLLESSKANDRPVMIDFFAEWCLDCKRMHRTTYKQPSVIQALNGWDIIEVDVTVTSDISQKVKQGFGVFGPPATLFYNADGSEQKSLRQYGYMSEDVFLNVINQVRG